MAYEVGLESYASAWVGVTGTFVLMAKRLREKTGSLYSNDVDRVDVMNGGFGLDSSVDAAEIARGHILPTAAAPSAPTTGGTTTPGPGM